ncbi:MAG: class I SAM-dependent methyltransferase [Phycisphaerae bacterium]|nr:class I SAM-dependent methyltransferase [Phycisphaerae bacterium]
MQPEDYKYPREASLVPHYERHLEYYSPVPAIMPALVEAFGLDMGQVGRALDVGCGDGRLSIWLAETHGVAVDGVDYSPQRIERARANARTKKVPVQFECQDLNHFLEERATRYDLMVIFEVLEHLENPAGVIEQCRRLLAPGGRILGSVPLRMPYVAHLQVFQDIDDVRSRLQPARVGTVDDQHPHVYLEWRCP